MKVRTELLELFNRYNDSIRKVESSGWNYNINITESVLEDMRDFYIPKAFEKNGHYLETNNFNNFILNNYPYYVFDAIELFAQYNSNNNFTDEVNLILEKHEVAYRLLGGKIEISNPIIQTKEIVKEPGLRELIIHAQTLYNSTNISDKQIATEKIWDAFERLKTYYKDLSKKQSVEKIIFAMSNGDKAYKKLLDEEFIKLTHIGNNFRIRHHETDTIDIIDSNYYEYFFRRCFALIDLALKYLE